MNKKLLTKLFVIAIASGSLVTLTTHALINDKHHSSHDHGHEENNQHDETELHENHQRQTIIDPTTASENGIETDIARPGVITETLDLNGRIQLDPDRLSQVRGRYPGVVKRIHRQLGDHVKAGDVLAEIQSNESLQTYQLKAPIKGIIIDRNIQPGETTDNNALFTIADLSKVWAELDVFDKDSNRIKAHQLAQIESLNGNQYTGTIDWLSPITTHASQSTQARVIINNPELSFRPGQYVRARITVADHPVDLAVRTSAIQRSGDFSVLYTRLGNAYEMRRLKLGRSNPHWVEVLDGLKPDSEYVSKNSYLIKADIEKAGASHDH